jgi:hypothetical protein
VVSAATSWCSLFLPRFNEVARSVLYVAADVAITKGHAAGNGGNRGLSRQIGFRETKILRSLCLMSIMV